MEYGQLLPLYFVLTLLVFSALYGDYFVACSFYFLKSDYLLSILLLYCIY